MLLLCLSPEPAGELEEIKAANYWDEGLRNQSIHNTNELCVHVCRRFHSRIGDLKYSVDVHER